MGQRAECVVDVPFELPCTIKRRGHRDLIPRGVFVKCVYDHATVGLYAKLEEDRFTVRHPVPDDLKLTMKDAGIGSIIDHRYFTCPLELCKAKIWPPSYDYELKKSIPADVREVYEDLYYYVAFKKGMFWARYDWVEVVTDPV